MNTRFKFSALLVAIGFLLAFLPDQKNTGFRLNPSRLNFLAASDTLSFSADQVARFINSEDSTIRLIDVRDPSEYRECRIPGSVNIPLEKFSDKTLLSFLNSDKVKNVFYSNGDQFSSVAWTIATGLGYKNTYLMKGGLNEWYDTVMNTHFSGERISAKENLIFENRFKARRLFNEFNSLPDSLKVKLFASKQAARKKLDGGCE